LGKLDLQAGGTAVLMVGDHGEAFGEGGAWKHEDVFEPQVHVPLIVRTAQAQPVGRRIEDAVSGIDVAPTLLGLAGLGAVAASLGMDGIDLAQRDPGPQREVLIEDRDHLDPREVNVALVRLPYKLVRRGLGKDAVFSLHDLRVDRDGAIDLSTQEPVVFQALKARLQELRAKADLEDAAGGGTFIQKSARDGLAGLGYTGR